MCGDFKRYNRMLSRSKSESAACGEALAYSPSTSTPEAETPEAGDQVSMAAGREEK